VVNFPPTFFLYIYIYISIKELRTVALSSLLNNFIYHLFSRFLSTKCTYNRCSFLYQHHPRSQSITHTHIHTQASASRSSSLLLSGLQLYRKLRYRHMLLATPSQHLHSTTMIPNDCPSVTCFLSLPWDCLPLYFDSPHTVSVAQFKKLCRGWRILTFFIHLSTKYSLCGVGVQRYS
jgi:hypothetical protein